MLFFSVCISHSHEKKTERQRNKDRKKESERKNKNKETWILKLNCLDLNLGSIPYNLCDFG